MGGEIRVWKERVQESAIGDGDMSAQQFIDFDEGIVIKAGLYGGRFQG
jgi:hypothetical protein